MDYEQAKDICHVRSAIFRSSKKVKYWKDHIIPLDIRVPYIDKQATDWQEYDPRDNDDCSLFMYND